MPASVWSHGRYVVPDSKGARVDNLGDPAPGLSAVAEDTYLYPSVRAIQAVAPRTRVGQGIEPVRERRQVLPRPSDGLCRDPLGLLDVLAKVGEHLVISTRNLHDDPVPHAVYRDPGALVRGQRVERFCAASAVGNRELSFSTTGRSRSSLGKLLLPGNEALRLCRAGREQPLALACVAGPGCDWPGLFPGFAGERR
jgi:hypothetical protein